MERGREKKRERDTQILYALVNKLRLICITFLVAYRGACIATFIYYRFLISYAKRSIYYRDILVLKILKVCNVGKKMKKMKKNVNGKKSRKKTKKEDEERR